MNSKENRIFWLDMSRVIVIAIAGVVLIHAIVPLLYDYDKKAAPGWWVGNISDSPVRMSVPIFVMITGALLLKHEDNPIPFLWKKLPKLIIPLLVWGTIYKYFRPETLPTISFFQAFLEIIQGQAHFHLWFMYMIIGLYFSIPVFQVFVKYASKEILYYFICVWFLAVSGLPLVNRFFDINISLQLTLLTGYSGYLILGFLISNIPSSKKTALISAGLYIVSIIATASANFVLTYLHQGNFDGYFRDNFSPTVILMSVSAFMLLKSFEHLNIQKHKTFEKIITAFSDTSYGIYLTHIIFLTWITNDFSPFPQNPMYLLPTRWAITMILSFLLVYVLKRIPILKYVVP